MATPLISVVIPTFNRRELVLRAVRSVLAQTQPVEQVIVVDDGSTDGTGEVLGREFGGRIEYLWQENAGVSAARNRGLERSAGRYLALLDSDDCWHPDKTRLQLDWLEDHPDYGMVLCDVTRVDEHGRQINVLRRREAIPHDGDVLGHVLLQPALVPASVMIRRQVFETVGGFDTSLATGEDLDFHLRVAQQWKIGIVERSLVTAVRGHEGLSTSSTTYTDYIRVIEKFVAGAREQLPGEQLDAALANAYRRTARGLILEGQWRQAIDLATKALACAPGGPEKFRTLELAPVALRKLGGEMKRSIRAK
jgi:glycosyltransferase involved in cell wall biosynthesis